MATPKLTGFLIGIVLIGLFASVFGMYISSLADGYDDVSYNSEQLNNYSKAISVIKNDTEAIKESTKVNAKSSALDILGGYFSAAYKSVRISFNSFSLFDKMISDGIDDAGSSTMGNVTGVFKTSITVILLILVFVGIFVAMMVKWETI